jgi:hypothetical protein
MRIILTVQLIAFLFVGYIATGQQQDSIQFYKRKADKTAMAAKQDDSIRTAFLQQRASRYKFKRWGWDLLGKVATGFVTVNTTKNQGLLTGSHEAAGKIQYYIKRKMSDGSIRTHPTSLFTTIGWGPTLVAKETIPNFWYFTGGVQLNHFGSSTSYGLVTAVNSSGNDSSTKVMYGITVSLEGTQIPVFITYLRSDHGFCYLVLAGFKISVKRLIPTRSQRLN